MTTPFILFRKTCGVGVARGGRDLGLQRFAGELRIAAEATPRRTRGRVRKADHGAVLALRKRRITPNVNRLARREVLSEMTSGRPSILGTNRLSRVRTQSDGVISTTDTTFSTLELRMSTGVALGGVVGTARATLGRRHAFGTVSPLSTFAFAGSSPFSTAGMPIAREAALVDTGLDFNLSAAAVLGISYGGRFAPDVLDQTVRSNLTVKF